MPFIGAYRSIALAGMGMVAATSVQPSAGLSSTPFVPSS
jgi:hypothetical protein